MSENSAVTDDRAESGGAPHAGPSGPGFAAPESLAPTIEAILISAERPVSAQRLAEALGIVPESAGDDPGEPPRGRRPGAAQAASGRMAVERAIGALNEAYAAGGRSFRIEQVAGGYRLMTLPEFAPAVGAFHASRAGHRLSPAAVETLAIIAYKQPITRAALESIRGVACGEVLRSLMERRLVTIAGRAEELGRPILYGTTRQFLDAFGLATLKDLPASTEIAP